MRTLLSCLILLSAALAQTVRSDAPDMKPRTDGALTAITATIAVCTQPANTATTPCSPLATLYSDATLTTPCSGVLKDGSLSGAANCSNPLISDARGNHHFYAAPGVYTVQTYGTGVTTLVQVDQAVPCDPSNCLTSKLNGTLVVGDGITIWSGADIGAQINSAYAALPATGGRIHVAARPGATCYSFTTPIVFGTSGKPAVLTGDTGGSCLTYTPTSGTAFTCDTGQGESFGCGMRDITLKGSCAATPCASGTAVGVQIGGSNGAIGGEFSNVTIGNYGASFQTGIVQASASGGFLVRFSHVNARGNTYGFYNNLGAASAENLIWDHGCICGNQTGAYLHGAGDYSFDAVSWDDNKTVAVDANANLYVRLRKGHFENSGGGTCQYLTTAGNTKAVLSDSIFIEARTSATCSQFITWASDSLIVGNNLYQVSGAGSTVTQAVNPSAGSVVSYGNRVGSGVTAPILSSWYSGGGNGWECESFPNTAGCTFNAQIKSYLATGTAPLVVASTTPVANLTAVPTTYNHSGTQQTGVHLVSDKCTLGTDCAVTLAGSAVFSSSTSYQCTCADATAAAACRANQTSGSAVTFTGTATDVILYHCIGN